MKTKLLLTLLLISVIGYAQVQPTVYNATFDNIPKSSGSDCSCSGWINKDIADQGESSTLSGNSVVKYDDFESDGIYQEVAVVANSDYTLDLDYTYKTDPTTTMHLEVTILKGSGYVSGYTPAYDPPATAAQSGYGYDTVAAVELPANQIAQTLITPPGNTSANAMTQMTFNTGTETSIAIFVRAVGPYDAASHGDPGKDKGWMNGDSEVRMDNLALVNTTNLSTDDFLASNVKVYPNPARDFITVESNTVQLSSVSVFDVLGKNVLTQNKLTNNRIDVSSLVSGIYFVKINSEDATTTRKIIIE